MDIHELESILESILFASGEPVAIRRIAAAVGVSEDDIEQAVSGLSDYLSFGRRGVRLVRMEDRLQLCTRTEYADVIRRVLETRRAPSLSQAALEVLAIIAYRQPVTRAYVEQVRGVDSSGTIGMLAERGLIAECGRLEVPGRPVLFRTTDVFLRSFGISSIDELPEFDTDDGVQMSIDMAETDSGKDEDKTQEQRG